MTKTRKTILFILSINLTLLIIITFIFIIMAKYSRPYNDMLDKIKFEQLCNEVIASNIQKITVTKPNEDMNYITDFSIFDGMSYKESAWNVKTNEWIYRVGVHLQNNLDEILFSSSGTDHFLVYYKSRLFIVELPKLLSSAKIATEE